MSNQPKSISLVLGSGGARGHAHIGVIRAIAERGHNINNIAGTSMGAVIGGIYAAGKLDTYVDWANRLEKNDVLKLLDFSFTWKSIFKGERIIEVLKELIGDCQIEELERDFTAVATSLSEQREVWLNSGSLFRAIRASTAVPGVFAPVELDGVILVDGGLVNPIPIAPTLTDATDLTIAVNLSGLTDSYRPPADRKSAPASKSDEGYREKISQFIGSLMENGESDESDTDAADLLVKSIDVMQGAIARLKLAAYTPDKVIDVPRDACSFFEFNRAEEMAELGYKQASAALDDLGL
ncbi:MAG: patatin-like phospholipase family protein [Gammaproteobacteria bacterium]|nr:patatin-like phospholipase family protein [Gammaproteobacteria bacterium]NNC57734.1 serine protease [Woeseiaceae bacterium]